MNYEDLNLEKQFFLLKNYGCLLKVFIFLLKNAK